MTVFKVFLTIFKRNWKSLIIYLIVFVVFGSISASANADTMKKSFESRSLNVAIIDNDKSGLSRAVTDYIKKDDKKVDLKTNNLKKINDYIRFGIADYAVVIPKGYQDNIGNGDSEIKYIAGETTTSEAIMTRKLNTYINDVKAYKQSGLSIDKSIDKAKIATDVASDSDVKMISPEVKQGTDILCFLFNFASYGLYMILCESIGMVLVAIRDEDVRNRISISAYSYLRENAEIVLGILVSALIMVVPFIAYSAYSGMASPEYGKIGYYVLNLLITMLPGISIGYLISSLTNDDSIINLISNSVVLTMSFISGVFISKEILSVGVLKFARFFPMYWFVEGNDVINNNPVGNILGYDFAVCAIMQLLFAVVILAAGLAINRIKERA